MSNLSTTNEPSAQPRAKKGVRFCVNEVVLRKNSPAVTVDDLALMLEIDLSMGCKEDFKERLQKALNAVARAQGQLQ